MAGPIVGVAEGLGKLPFPVHLNPPQTVLINLEHPLKWVDFGVENIAIEGEAIFYVGVDSGAEAVEADLVLGVGEEEGAEFGEAEHVFVLGGGRFVV